MKAKVLVLVLSFCLVAVATPYRAQAGSSRSGDCGYNCQKRKELEVLTIIYGGTFVLAVTIGALYYLIRGDDGGSELANRIETIDDQRFRLVPHSSHAGGQGLDLEFRLNDDTMIGLRARFRSGDSEASKWSDTNYFGGAFCRLSF
jgi:hypothetical protein